MKKTRPHFIAIGAPHSGLGLLMKLIAAHPGSVSMIPSLSYFNTSTFDKKDINWYESQFLHMDAGRVTGECTPLYLSSKEAPVRIARYFPDTKLIAVVRNPIDRAVAHYEQARQSPKKRYSSCAPFLNDHPEAQTLGFYGQQLKEYFGYYSPLQIHVIVYEEMVADPLRTLRDLYVFLGLAPDFVPRVLRPLLPPEAEPKRRSLIYRLKNLVKRLMKRLFQKPAQPLFPPPCDPSECFSRPDLKALKAMYAPDAALLSTLLHRNMGVYWGLTDEES